MKSVSDEDVKDLLRRWLGCRLPDPHRQLVTALQDAMNRSRLEFDGHAEVFWQENPILMMQAVDIARIEGVK